ncbi:CG33758, partial [Drosophila busckii]
VQAKFRSLNCDSCDKNFGQFKLCEIKAVNRSLNLINIIYKFNGLLDNTSRASGWRPFLYDIKFELCELIEKGKPYVANLLFGYIKPYTNLNQTCPKQPGFEFKMQNYKLNMELFRQRFPIDAGEYAVNLKFFNKQLLRFIVNGSISYTNYKD